MSARIARISDGPVEFHPVTWIAWVLLVLLVLALVLIGLLARCANEFGKATAVIGTIVFAAMEGRMRGK